MEKNQLQKTAPTNSAILPAVPAERIVKAVYQFNQLRAFSLTQVEMLEWARSIERLCPALDVDALNFVIDQLKLAELPYDNTKGIQNILMWLPKVRKNEDGTFKILKSIW